MDVKKKQPRKEMVIKKRERGQHFTDEEKEILKKRILTLVSSGKSVASIAGSDRVPCSEQIVCEWSEDDLDFYIALTRAREIGKWVRFRKSYEQHLEGEYISAENFTIASKILNEHLKNRPKDRDVLDFEDKDGRNRLEDDLKSALNHKNSDITSKLLVFWETRLNEKKDDEPIEINPEEVEKARALLQNVDSDADGDKEIETKGRRDAETDRVKPKGTDSVSETSRE